MCGSFVRIYDICEVKWSYAYVKSPFGKGK
jgi:hypothetical protein